MRVEPITIGGYAHDLKRGGHGVPIIRDIDDQYRFVRSLYYLNDVFIDKDWPNAAYKASVGNMTHTSPTSITSRTSVK